MTNTPGEGRTPQDPSGGQDQPGYWEQQSQGQQGPAPYGQYGQYYGQPGYPAQPPSGYAPDHPRAATVLVLGILGIVACGLVAPFAWSMGRTTLREIDASQGSLGGRGAANAGYVLGIIGTVLLGLSVLVLLGMLALFGITAVTTSGY